jgi:hypothetical protein
MAPIEFRAPWARSLRISTIVSTAVLVAIAAMGCFAGIYLGLAWVVILIGLPTTILFATVPTMTIGYRLTEHEIQVKRLSSTVTLPIATLMAVEGKIDAMHGSVCLLANPGVFSLTGIFWNRQLKLYRAYATDPSRAVILRYPKQTIVITPHDPQHFIVRARTLMKTMAYPG